MALSSSVVLDSVAGADFARPASADTILSTVSPEESMVLVSQLRQAVQDVLMET